MQNSESLACFEFSSIAEGYASLNALLEKLNVEVVEAAPLPPGKFLAFLKGDSSVLKTARQSLEENSFLVADAFVEKPHRDLLNAIYGLTKTELEEGLLVIEASSFPSCLSVVHAALSASEIKPIELKTGRGIGGKSVAYLTGRLNELDLAHQNICNLTNNLEGYQIRLIRHPNSKFASFFRIS